MKIGITERGDAALDLTWARRLKEVDGAILITKDCRKKGFREELKTVDKPIILHATCTGMGGGRMELNVPAPLVQLMAVKDIIQSDILPAERIVIRIDPIYPYDLWFLSHLLDNINKIFSDEEIQKMRFRVSVMDFYPHVKERLISKGFEVPDGFQASYRQMRDISEILAQYPHMTFETCAEDRLTGPNIIHTGCVSAEDISRMGLKTNEELTTNPQRRKGCLCLSCKTELLNNKYRCPHQCLYCYWKDTPKS